MAITTVGNFTSLQAQAPEAQLTGMDGFSVRRNQQFHSALGSTLLELNAVLLEGDRSPGEAVPIGQEELGGVSLSVASFEFIPAHPDDDVRPAVIRNVFPNGLRVTPPSKRTLFYPTYPPDSDGPIVLSAAYRRSETGLEFEKPKPLRRSGIRYVGFVLHSALLRHS